MRVSMWMSAVTIGLWVAQVPIFTFLNNKWFDLMSRPRSEMGADPRISVIAIDDTTLKTFNGFAAAGLARPLVHYGVKVVGYDVLYLKAPASRRIERDFIAATKMLGERFVHATMGDPDEPIRFVFQPPFPGLAQVTKSVGAVNLPFIDSDGVLRQTCIVIGSDKHSSATWSKDPDPMPILAAKVASVFEGKPIAEYLQQGNAFFINFRSKSGQSGQEKYGVRMISARKLIEGKLNCEELRALRDGIALVGYTSVATGDLFPTPLNSRTPGVVIQAKIVDNLLNRRQIQRVSPLVTLVLIVSLALLAVPIVRLSPVVAASLVGTVFCCWVTVVQWAFVLQVLLDFSQPLFSFLATFGLLYVDKAAKEVRARKHLKRTLGQFVAPQVVATLAASEEELQLGGEEREMTVLFLDIAHFTTISEQLDPKALIALLNKYLSRFSRAIHLRDGVVDKYIGDCVMAFWNAPVQQRDHHARACLAALDCLAVLEELNRDPQQPLKEMPSIRIGINSGRMVVGLTGSSEKLQYTVIGDEVNVASRLEGANKWFGTRIIAGERCFLEAKEVLEGRELGLVQVVGKAGPVRVYEVLGKRGELTPEWRMGLPVYERAMHFWKEGKRSDAETGFNEVLKIFPEDKVSELFLKGLARDDWGGIFKLDAK